ncbi:MAG: M20 family metallo-hydrolase [Clostridiales bacterium]|nr:M20 family metallo-hydrolase [Clostridiales bacterium]
MKINAKRLLDNLNNLKKFTDTPGKGVTRFSYGSEDIKAREYIASKVSAAGCSVHEDALHNLRIGLKDNSTHKKTVVAGSHIDTVKNGGWLDGIYGVCGAMEVIETLAKSGASFHNNYEMVIFAEEEGSNFDSTMTGSKFITGFYDESTLDSLRNDIGESLRDVLLDFNKKVDGSSSLDVSNIRWDFNRIKSMFELHIEQGPVLDQQKLSLGIVESIFGMRVIEVILTGVGNHAGATPMTERFDALSVAAQCITTAEDMVRSDPDKRTVVTVGKLEVKPNCSNVIPEAVKFYLEVRDKDRNKIDFYIDEIKSLIFDIAESRDVKCEMKEHSKSTPLRLNKRLMDKMVSKANDQNLAYKVMDSGAVHDACMIANFADTGMIFVPSINGRSHVPEENTDKADLITGVQFLLDIIIDELKEG